MAGVAVSVGPGQTNNAGTVIVGMRVKAQPATHGTSGGIVRHFGSMSATAAAPTFSAEGTVSLWRKISS